MNSKITAEMVQAALTETRRSGNGRELTPEGMNCPAYFELVEFMLRHQVPLQDKIGGTFIAGVETGLRLAEMLAVEEIHAE